MTKTARNIKTGDTWNHWRNGIPIPCTALHDAERSQDMFGTTMARIWTTTGTQDGWTIYGPDTELDTTP